MVLARQRSWPQKVVRLFVTVDSINLHVPSVFEGGLRLSVLQKNCSILCWHWPSEFPPERILARHCFRIPVLMFLSNVGQYTSRRRWCSVLSSTECIYLVKFHADLVNVEFSPLCVFENWVYFPLFLGRIAAFPCLPCRSLEHLYQVSFLKRIIVAVAQ